MESSIDSAEYDLTASILRVDGDTGVLAGGMASSLPATSMSRPAMWAIIPQPDGALLVDHSGRGAFTAIRPEEVEAEGKTAGVGRRGPCLPTLRG